MPDSDLSELTTASGAFARFKGDSELLTGIYRQGSAHLRRSVHELEVSTDLARKMSVRGNGQLAIDKQKLAISARWLTQVVLTSSRLTPSSSARK